MHGVQADQVSIRSKVTPTRIFKVWNNGLERPYQEESMYWMITVTPARTRGGNRDNERPHRQRDPDDSHRILASGTAHTGNGKFCASQYRWGGDDTTLCG